MLILQNTHLSQSLPGITSILPFIMHLQFIFYWRGSWQTPDLLIKCTLSGETPWALLLTGIKQVHQDWWQK